MGQDAAVFSQAFPDGLPELTNGSLDTINTFLEQGSQPQVKGDDGQQGGVAQNAEGGIIESDGESGNDGNISEEAEGIDNLRIRYSPVNPGPLDYSIAISFTGAVYTKITLTEDTIFYRVYGGAAKKVRSFMSRTLQYGGLQSQLDLALDPKWGNTAQYITQVIVPKGTVIFEGTAAPQVINGGTGILPGGGNQIFIPEVDSSWFGE